MIYQAFPVPIYLYNVDREFFQQEKEVFEKIYYESRTNLENVSGIDECILNDRRLKEIKLFIEAHLNQYTFNAFNRDHRSFIEITTSWLNLTQPGQSHHYHSHPNSFYSGVFYYNTIPNDTITFGSPHQGLHQLAYTNKAEYLTGECHVPVKNGDLIIFPSALNHRVSKNNSQDNRISLAFNTIVKGEIGYDISKIYID